MNAVLEEQCESILDTLPRSCCTLDLTVAIQSKKDLLGLWAVLGSWVKNDTSEPEAFEDLKTPQGEMIIKTEMEEQMKKFEEEEGGVPSWYKDFFFG